MKRRHKLYLKLNLMSIVFLIVSLISVTLAWFAYSGLAEVETEIDVKAWNIEIEKDGQKVSNDIVISLDDIYPGMDTVSELVNIKNLGDSDAQISYEIKSVRILGDEEDKFIIDGQTIKSEYVEDLLSHEYPFHININLSKKYAISKTGQSTFNVSVSWPLDSDNDELDSLWGKSAYDFEEYQSSMKLEDESYQTKPSIQIVISVTAEQYIASDTSSDPNYNLGDEVLFDVVNNERCTTVSATCLKTHIIDINNTLGDTIVNLIPDFSTELPVGDYNSYSDLYSSYTTSWTVNKRPLIINDILNIVSGDVVNTRLVRTDISDLIVGNLNYNNRFDTEINRIKNYNGYINFLNQRFSYFISSNCYWVNSDYDEYSAFAIKAIDEMNSNIYKEGKNSSCRIVPVLIVNKTDL